MVVRAGGSFYVCFLEGIGEERVRSSNGFAALLPVCVRVPPTKGGEMTNSLAKRQANGHTSSPSLGEPSASSHLPESG